MRTSVQLRTGLSGLLLATALAACASPPSGVLAEPAAANGAKRPATPATPAAAVSKAPGASTAVAPPARLGQGTGQVLGLDGAPAAGIRVSARLIGLDGSTLIGQDGSTLIGQDSSTLIGQDGSTLIGQDGSTLIGQDGSSLSSPNGGALTKAYRLRQASSGLLEAVTDADGRFALPLAAGQPYTVEAVKDDNAKAIQLAVRDPQALTLKLERTGTITGRVTPPAGSTVTNLLGVDVYIPGTSYGAKTSASGAFTISHVPVGTFALHASKVGLGTRDVAGVAVKPEATTDAGGLQLALATPRITGFTPDASAIKGTVLIKGEHFGASTGEPLSVSIGGALAGSVKRLDDQTIEVSVPEAAVGGDVIVTVGGIQSPVAKLPMAEYIEIRLRLRHLSVGAQVPFEADLMDEEWAHVPGGSPQWTASGTAFTVDAGGTVKGVGPGTGTLTAAVGDVKTTLEITVHDGLSVSTLAGPDDGEELKALTRKQMETPDYPGYTNFLAFKKPSGLAVDADGTIYISDADENLVQAISPAGRVTILAGYTKGLKDGNGREAAFDGPEGLALDGQGHLFVADARNNRIRQIDLRDPAHRVTTFAGGGPTSGGGNQTLANLTDGQGDAARFLLPAGLAIDAAAGKLYVADLGNQAIRQISLAGAAVTTLAGPDAAVATGRAGLQDGPGLTARFSDPTGLAIGGTFLYIADAKNQRVRRLDLAAPAPTVTTVAGGAVAAADGLSRGGDFTNGVGEAARFFHPAALAVGPDGALIVADRDNDVLRRVVVDAGGTGTVSTLVGGESGIAGARKGFVDGSAASARFKAPRAVALDRGGRIVVADQGNAAIRLVDLGAR